MEEVKSAFQDFNRDIYRKRPLTRPSRRWENNIRKYLKEIGINTRNWSNSVQDRNYWRALADVKLNPPGFIAPELGKGLIFLNYL